MPESFGVFSAICEQDFPKRRAMRVALSFVEAVFLPSDALRPQRGQMFAVQVSMASVRLLNWMRYLCNLLTRSTRFLTLRPTRSKNEPKRHTQSWC